MFPGLKIPQKHRCSNVTKAIVDFTITGLLLVLASSTRGQGGVYYIPSSNSKSPLFHQILPLLYLH